MSYKAAWEAIESMNNLSTTPIVQRETGGSWRWWNNTYPLWRKSYRDFEILKRSKKNFLKI